jgi:large subunit ribosomal protein L4e
VGAYADVEKAKASRNIRRGKGKMRNRRYVGRKGPLVVFGEEGGISKAFRNLPGVEVSSVDSLNLLQVCLGATSALVIGPVKLFSALIVRLAEQPVAAAC